MGSAHNNAPGILAPLAALACLLGLTAGQANAGLALATSLIAGIVVYAALTTLLRRKRERYFRHGAPIDDSVLLASLGPDEASQLEQSAIQLADRLDATKAELAVFERRALRAEEQVRESLRLLEAVAENALPRVEAIEELARELVGTSEASLDRRGPAGRIAHEAASIHMRLADIAALARIDSAEVRRDAVPSRLSSLLEKAAGPFPHVSTSVDPAVPDLLMIERTTFGHALHDLFAHLEEKGLASCHAEATAQAAAGDLAQVEIRVLCNPGLEARELELLAGAESRLGLVPRDSGSGLSLALAARALARMGGRVESREQGRCLLIELVLPVAAERRLSRERERAASEHALELIETS